MTADPSRGDPPLVALDANVFDRLGRDSTDLARALRGLLDDGRLRLVVPAGVAAELAHPNAPPEVRSALSRATPLPRIRRTPAQEIDRIRVRAILRGDGRPGKHDADAAHLSDAAEAGCSVFVTGDGKILRKRDILAQALSSGPEILTLAELLSRPASRE